MSDQATILADYRGIVLGYFSEPAEPAERWLQEAYELGRRALREGFGLLELIAMHDGLVDGLVATKEINPTASLTGRRILQELLAPFELAFRGFREATDRMRRSASELEQRVRERTSDLHEAERRFRSLVEQTPGVIYVAAARGPRLLSYVSPQIQSLLGVDPGRSTWDEHIHSEDRAQVVAAWLEAGERGVTFKAQYRLVGGDGRILWVEDQATLTLAEAGPLRQGVVVDTTARRALEEQLRQSQKMDAVGRLAGGVAHDFNNVLSVILIYGELLLADLKPGDPMRGEIEEMQTAGKRGADLTRQLLMFSRQQVLEPRVLDLNEVLTSMDKMLQRILGDDVDLVSLPASQLGRVRADPGSLEQVIMNLVVNARDSMPTGGKLTMETGDVVLDEAYAQAHVGAKPGPYVMLAVTDSGTGMNKATLARIFEPFFTTKAPGKGTGLGLSTVFGIVHQSEGSIWVYSEPGKGTTFKIYLPRVDGGDESTRALEPPAIRRGSETILLVEDDDQVRAGARTILVRNGYDVIEARSPGEALLHSEKHPGKIHLLLTDVVMPQMSGPELAKRLATSRPDLKVLCMSGFTDDSIFRHGVIEGHVAYLQKPITLQTLTAKLREVLDETIAGS